MVRSELLQMLCDNNPNLLKKDIKKILKIIFSEISIALQKEENIEIRGFGTYKVTKRKARLGRNPKNSSVIQIPEKTVFKSYFLLV